jgi:pimeloyl-ACP methyl ester carboxylesterase
MLNPIIRGVSMTAVALSLSLTLARHCAGAALTKQASGGSPIVRYHTVNIEGVDVFYREAGPADAPTILLLHGFPSSSFMFRNLIPRLAVRFHVVAPDYPGYGQSGSPDHAQFQYTFDHYACVVDELTQRLKLDHFTIYVHDIGAPIGYRIAAAHPERIRGIVVQNGNAYDEGLSKTFWAPIKAYWADPTEENRARLEGALTTKAYASQYLTGVRDPSVMSPDTWTSDLANLNRPGNKDVQLDHFLDYRTNPPLYPQWQAYFRRCQPPMLIVWGKNDVAFTVRGAEAYKRDLKNVEIHLFDTGHFALEDYGDAIAPLVIRFLDRNAINKVSRLSAGCHQSAGSL